MTRHMEGEDHNSINKGKNTTTTTTTRCKQSTRYIEQYMHKLILVPVTSHLPLILEGRLGTAEAT